MQTFILTQAHTRAYLRTRADACKPERHEHVDTYMQWNSGFL